MPLLLALMLMLALSMTAAAADTFTAQISLDNGENYEATVYSTLESAVAAANAATVKDAAIRIKFSGTQTFATATTLTLDSDVRLTAEGTAALSGPLTIDGGGVSRSIHIIQADTGAKLTLTGVTVQNFTTSTSYGAALRVEDKASTLTMTDCTIRNCSGQIGAIYVRKEGVVELTNCIVEGNTCTSTNGGVVHLNASTSTGKFVGTTFRNNTSATRSSAIYGVGSVTATNCTFEGNTGAAPAAVYFRLAATTATLTNCTFKGNRSTVADGAAVYVEAGSIAIDGVTMGGTAAADKNDPYDITVAGGTLSLKGSVAIGTICDGGGTVTLNDEISLAGSKKIGVEMVLADAFFAGRKMAENGDKFYIIGMDETETFAIHGRTGRLMTEKQAAIMEMGMAFYEKVSYTQYQQTSISGGSGSGYNRFLRQRREPFATLGEISPQKYTWVDCSSFSWALYNNTFSNFYENATSPYYPQTGEIMTMAKNANSNGQIGEDKMFVYYRPVTEAERTAAANGDLSTYTKIANEIKALLQPGDLVDFRRTTGTGHVVMYLGNGYTVESTGSDYDYVSMKDGWDASGSLKYRGLNSYLLKVGITSGTTGSIFRNNILEYVCVLRPINSKELTISDGTKALMRNSGMTASKTAMDRGQSVAPGETITYTITLDNDPTYPEHNGSALARSVTVTDPLAPNVTFVSATDGGSVKNGAVVFENVSVGAGEVVTVSYTVKVNEDAVGRIEGMTGDANGILFTCNDIVVGQGLSAEQQTTLESKFAAAKPSSTTALAWINGIYEDVIDKNFGVTTDSELFGALFAKNGSNSNSTIDGVKYTTIYKNSVDITKDGVASAVVDGITGGYGVFSQNLSEHRVRARYLAEGGLKYGDVIATVTAGGSYAYYVYRGSDMLKVTDSATSSADTATVLDSLPAMSRFALLRPSMIRSTNYVAKVASSYFETLEAAVAAAAETDGFDEVILLDDVTYTSAETLTLDGETRILIEAGSDVTISGPLTITGPGEEAASLMFRVNGGKLTLDGVTLKDYHNRGSGNNNSYGGLARVDTAGTLTLNGVTVENVSAANRGGAFYVTSSVLNVTDSTFKNNFVTESYGGSIVVYSDSTATVKNSSFIGNTSASYGGAIAIANSSGGSNTKIIGCTFTGNEANEDGAAVRTNGGTLSIEDCLFEENTASGAESYATVRIDNSDNAPTVSIKNSQIVNNSSVGTSSGIGIHLNGGTTTLENCTVTGNTRANAENYNDILVYAGALTLKGENTIDRLKFNEAMLAGVSGTVTGSIGILGASEGTQVLSGTVADVAASAPAFNKVLDENGAATDLIVGADGVVCKDVSVASYNGIRYETLTKALAGASAGGGGTVTLLADVTESPVRVQSGVTLDLNGKKLTAAMFITFSGSQVVDSSAGDLGRLVCANPMLQSTSGDLPILTDDGYLFTTATKMNQTGSGDGSKYTYIFLPKFASGADALASRGWDTGVHFQLVLSWDGGEKVLDYTPDLIKDVYANDKAFYAWITNYANYLDKNLTITVNVVSGNITIAGDPWAIA